MRIEPSGASAREVEEEHVGLAMQSTTDMQEEITRVARAKLDLQRRAEGEKVLKVLFKPILSECWQLIQS